MTQWVTHLGVLVLALSLLGCSRYYWSRPDGKGDEFVRESQECAKEAAPSQAAAQYGLVLQEIYRGCLRAKGWVREKQWDPPPDGWYRGIE